MHQVFLSSTAKDLAAFREVACKAISGLDGFHCVRMEDFGAGDAQADEFCRQRIAECQVAVFLVGLCYGSAPSGSDSSYTEREYQAAEAAGVPRLVFLSDDDKRWLEGEAKRAPGERMSPEAGPATETVTVSVEQALAEHRRLVVLGDPGSGKTTLLRYLTLPYARDLAEGTDLVEQRLQLAESGHLPIFLPLRQIGAFLKSAPDDGTEGHARLLAFLFRSLEEERIRLPRDFFDPWLTQGRAVILLDGLDEVADPGLRRRVARLVEGFVRAYPDCRYLVTSRIVGYTGAARLGESFVTPTVRDFSLADVEQFLTNWHRLIATGLMGSGPGAEAYAAEQTRQLMQAVQANERIRELAINPLMLTVIAMVHRDRVKLPDRRAELYAEAVDVLLGKWEEAKGVQQAEIIPGQAFDAGDKRLMLQQIALHMHRQQAKEIDVEALRELLQARFKDRLGDPQAATRAGRRFIDVIRERTGLLVARGEGIYAFSHLTFQEYLAALGLVARDSYLEDALAVIAEPWWHEVILLAAGYLSTQSQERTSRLVQAIAARRDRSQPYRNLVLAAECLRDVGPGRVAGGLRESVLGRLRQGVEAPAPVYTRWLKSMGARGWIEQRSRAMQALTSAGEGFWRPPYGEPEWGEIPAGEFWMGSESLASYSDERPLHKLASPAYRIARTPVTNAQYRLFIEATGHPAPRGWEDQRPPKGLEGHPVVNVSFFDALAYCAWLGRQIGQSVGLPSEAEWEKAAKGTKDRREYPWGERFELTRCNSWDLRLRSTTAVGVFPEGASPVGCLDMAGNVWEWTRSLWGTGDQPEFAYPYDPGDGREALDAPAEVRRVLRGGSFDGDPGGCRCAYRAHNEPDLRGGSIGFRVVVSPFL